MEQPHYEAPLPQSAVDEGPVLLRDGTAATLEPMRPETEKALAAFLEGLSADTLRHRFFGEVGAALALKQLLNPSDLHGSLVVLTGSGDDERIVAHGEYRANAGETKAEVAFLVSDTFQGKGLGTLLLERLALVAQREGIEQFFGPTEATNRKMREVFRESGFPVYECRDGAYVDISFGIKPSARSVVRFEEREKTATVASLEAFFEPQSVAVIGASRDTNSIGGRILANLVEHGFKGALYPVNPRAETLHGLEVYPNLSAAPQPVDLAVIATPARAGGAERGRRVRSARRTRACYHQRGVRRNRPRGTRPAKPRSGEGQGLRHACGRAELFGPSQHRARRPAEREFLDGVSAARPHCDVVPKRRVGLSGARARPGTGPGLIEFREPRQQG